MNTKTLSTGSNGSCTKESLQTLVCPKCNVKYPNIHELLTHQGSEKHFACNQCDSCFWTDDGLQDHRRKNHRPALDLVCFGCQSHFSRAAIFWRHLESNECKVIFPSDIARLRDKNLEFAKQLELRKQTLDDIIKDQESHIKGDDTWAPQFKGTTPSTEPVVAPDIPSRPSSISPGNAHPLHYRSEDFPVLPIKQRVPTTHIFRGEPKGNVWSNHKVTSPRVSNSTPASYNAVPPPAFYDNTLAPTSKNTMRDLAPNGKIRTTQATVNPTENGPHSTTSSGRIIDPNDPDYNPAVFHNEILEKFVCPYKSCGKKFHNAFTLTQHLRSPAHNGGRISCICCKKICTTVATLIGHMETATNCPIRDTDSFQRALGQITGGIMGYHRRSGMFYIDKSSVEELFNLRSKSLTESKREIKKPDAYIPKPLKSLEDSHDHW